MANQTLKNKEMTEKDKHKNGLYSPQSPAPKASYPMTMRNVMQWEFSWNKNHPSGWVLVLLLSDFLLPLGTFPGSNSSNDIAVSMGTRLLQRGKMRKDIEAGKGQRTWTSGWMTVKRKGPKNREIVHERIGYTTYSIVWGGLASKAFLILFQMQLGCQGKAICLRMPGNADPSNPLF